MTRSIQEFEQCVECKRKGLGMFPLVKSSVIKQVNICGECKTKNYPWLKKGQCLPLKQWLDPTMRPKDLEPTEYGEGKKLKRNGMKKCQYNAEGHVFELTKPKHFGILKLKQEKMTVREVYEMEIASAVDRMINNPITWLKGKVFMYWVCKHCQKNKFDVLPIKKAEEVIATL